MAAEAIPLTGVNRIHTYHGEAELLEMTLEEPFFEKVRPQGYVKLYGPGDESHYQFKSAGPFRVEGIISYHGGYTQVAGHRSTKPGHGYATLTTAVTEGLNILDVVTADRVVAQISTEHPLDGAVPEVSFLGTRFENLRIAGHKVDLDVKLDVLGQKPENDGSYFHQEKVMGWMANQYRNISAMMGLPDWAKKDYPAESEAWKSSENGGTDVARCSLVNQVGCDQKSYGHMIEIPHFGKFYLGELEMRRKAAEEPNEFDAYTFKLTMIRFVLGCPTQGSGGNTTADSNGQGRG